MTRGGPRPGAGRKVTTGRSRQHGGSAVYVQLSQAERAEIEAVLRDGETAAKLARDLLLREVRKRLESTPAGLHL